MNKPYFADGSGAAPLSREAPMPLEMRRTLPPLLLALESEAAATSSLVTYLRGWQILSAKGASSLEEEGGTLLWAAAWLIQQLVHSAIGTFSSNVPHFLDEKWKKFGKTGFIYSHFKYLFLKVNFIQWTANDLCVTIKKLLQFDTANSATWKAFCFS